MPCINAVYAVVRCTSVTFLYCVKTAKDTAIVAVQCDQETVARTEDAPVLDCSAPLRRFHDSGAGYEYPDLLTYLLTYFTIFFFVFNTV